MNQRKLGLEIHIADLAFKRACDECEEIANEKQLTGTHGYILGYLAKQGDAPVYQRDIESHFGIRRSSASALLTLMERNGLVERHAVTGDARTRGGNCTPTPCMRSRAYRRKPSKGCPRRTWTPFTAY